MKSERRVNAAVKRLRLLSVQEDRLLARVAWEVEHAIRWAREDTQGWPEPDVSVKAGVALIRQEKLR